MAKLASQKFTVELSKAVSNDASGYIEALDNESISQLIEAITALAGDPGIVVDFVEQLYVGDE